MGIIDFEKGKKKINAKEKTFDEIMRDITSGLTNDPDKDKEYLIKKADEYKDHKYKLEIARACGRILAKIIPKEKMKEFTDIVGKSELAIEKTLDEVNFNIYKKDFDKALSIMEGLVDSVEKLDMFADDKVSIYLDFDELMELILYQIYENPERMIRRPSINYHYIYTLYGSVLFEVKDFAKAKIYLEKALRWNPVSVQTAFEMGEILKIEKDLEGYYELNKKIYRNIFKRADMARYLRNMSYYFIEKELFEVASACLYISLSYEQSAMAKSELFYIEQTTGKSIDFPEDKELTDYSEKYGVMFQPCRDIAAHALSFANFAFKNNDMENVEYMLKTVYEFILPDLIRAEKEAESDDAGSVEYLLRTVYEFTHFAPVKEMYDKLTNK